MTDHDLSRGALTPAFVFLSRVLRLCFHFSNVAAEYMPGSFLEGVDDSFKVKA